MSASGKGALVGAALVFGDDVNTDLLHPSYFYSLDDETVKRGFLGAVEGHEGNGAAPARPRILVAGENFGCGSSRETTLRSLELAGVIGLVAVSFGRIFMRNALAVGLPALTSPRARELASDGDEVELDPGALLARNRASGLEVPLDPLDPFWRRVLEAGGLMAFERARGSRRA